MQPVTAFRKASRRWVAKLNSGRERHLTKSSTRSKQNCQMALSHTPSAKRTEAKPAGGFQLPIPRDPVQLQKVVQVAFEFGRQATQVVDTAFYKTCSLSRTTKKWSWGGNPKNCFHNRSPNPPIGRYSSPLIGMRDGRRNLNRSRWQRAPPTMPSITAPHSEQ